MASSGILAPKGCYSALIARASCALAALLFCLDVLAQPSSLPREDFWVPDGEVRTVIETNGVVYVGGIFDYVSPVSETGSAFDFESGATLPDFPKITGAVKAVVTDNAGGWFIGGLFTSVGGISITNLAHIRSDRTVDTTWIANPDGGVLALVSAPGMLYVGGSFFHIGGAPHSLLAALDPPTGLALPFWRGDITSNLSSKPTVNALALAGGTLYAGGYFGSINGQPREHVGSMDAATGATTTWYPNGYTGAEAGARIDALAISGKVLYVGGNFKGIGGLDSSGVKNVLCGYLAALDVTKDLPNSVLTWNPNANGPVTCLAVSCDTVYAGGAFTFVGGQPRSRIAALNMSLNTNQATTWDPNANGDVLNVTLSGNIVYAGGKFTQIGGQSREFLAALDLHTGQASLWHPRADFGVAGVAISGGSIIAGGALGPGGKLRKNAAAFEARTGKPTDWNPQITGGSTNSGSLDTGVHTLAASANIIYLGGPFTNINGQLRNRAGAVHAVSGVLSNWNPNANGMVETLLNFGGKIYAGGFFTNIGGLMRMNLAALDAITGNASSIWNPGLDYYGKVLSLAGLGDNLYAGGTFTTIGGQRRNRFACLDTNSGALLPCNPGISDQLSAISVAGNTLFLGGEFTSIAGQAASHVGAIGSSACDLTCWRPEAQFVSSTRHATVNALAASSNLVFVGGTFNFIGAQPRNNLALVSTNCPGNSMDWDPNADGSIKALAVARGTLYAGGVFQNIGGRYRPSLAVFAPVGWPRVTLQPSSQLVSNGQTVTLTTAVTGQEPLAYQWQFNGTNLPGATISNLFISSAQASDSGEYTLVVTNALGLVHSRAALVTIISPLIIVTPPISQTVSPGGTVSLTVMASGSPPPTYQWRLNGVNIPGAIYSTLTFTNVQRTNSGSYSVIVANRFGATNSSVAILLVTGPSLGFSDNLTNRGTISGSFGSGGGNNQSATKETSEPNHAGKLGGKSLWIAWTPLTSGIATFHTRGSAFDTLLAVYKGTSYSNLVKWAADDDRAGFGASEVSFNADAGTEYLIAIDGFAGALGNLLLSWTNDSSTAQFPRIYTQPLSASVSTGAVAQFSVQVSSSSAINFQWFHDCHELVGETNGTLIINGVQPEDVGNYYVVVVNASSHTARSEDAFLEIGPDAKTLSQDKLEDLFLEAGGASEFRPASPTAVASGGFLSVAMGGIGSQIFNNIGATTQDGEPIPCGVIGGSSKWLGFKVATNGSLRIDTMGSSIDTVLAVYYGSSLADLHYVTCDNNGAPDGIRSVVLFPALQGTNYFVAVDGVGGAQGTNITLNWKFGLVPLVTSVSSDQSIHLGISRTLFVVAVSPTPDLSYVWRWNGTIIANATGPNLPLNNMQLGQAGTYSVVVSNFAGQVTNTIAVAVASPINVSYSLAGPTGNRQFRLTGPACQDYVIEGSSDLANWHPLSTNTSVLAPVNFLDPATANLPSRFYRVNAWP